MCIVYVLDQQGKPLMPTRRCGKVRRMLNDGRAKVVRRMPFTIKLLYDSGRHTQELTLGVDTGSMFIGAAVADPKGRILYASETEIRNDIKKKMDQRRMYRRNRRSRKTRYRKARFLNRGNSMREGRLPPTVRSKLESHAREIRFIHRILPVRKIRLECGQFDPHLLKNPEVYGKEYQQGTLYGYANTREYVLSRDGHVCQACKGRHKDPKLEAHHIVYRGAGGSDSPENLITLCHTCHAAVHAGKLALKLKGKAKGGLLHATQMNIIRKRLLEMFPDAIETFGYIAKADRQSFGLVKSHSVDASVIACNGKAPVAAVPVVYVKRHVAAGDYQRTNGIRSEKCLPQGKIRGFLKFDKVRYFGKDYFIKGRMSSGYAVLMDIYGNTVKFDGTGGIPKTPKFSRFKRISARKTTLVITECFGMQAVAC